MSTDPISAFQKEKAERISGYAAANDWQKLSKEWVFQAFQHKHMYNFEIMGRPIIQTPVEIVAVQELIWDVKPDLVIETGIAHGGSLILSAAALAMLDYCDALAAGTTLDPKAPKRKVLGVDIDIRDHNKKAIEDHPMGNRIEMIQGSSVSQETFTKVKAIADQYKRVMVFLDSNHTHDHVMEELKLYAPLTTKGSYCVVFDTIVEDLPANAFPDRPWGPGNNPKTAVHAYLELTGKGDQVGADNQPLSLEIDRQREGKLLITAAPDGYLLRT